MEIFDYEKYRKRFLDTESLKKYDSYTVYRDEKDGKPFIILYDGIVKSYVDERDISTRDENEVEADSAWVKSRVYTSTGEWHENEGNLVVNVLASEDSADIKITLCACGASANSIINVARALRSISDGMVAAAEQNRTLEEAAKEIKNIETKLNKEN